MISLVFHEVKIKKQKYIYMTRLHKKFLHIVVNNITYGSTKCKALRKSKKRYQDKITENVRAERKEVRKQIPASS